tara:strand:- start:112 stop:270 length:159 start_codon:yes stop_codon:yes gene_type:complete
MHYFLLEISGYLDPTSLSFFAQMLIGVFIGLGVAIKIYWEKIKLKFSRTKLD